MEGHRLPNIMLYGKLTTRHRDRGATRKSHRHFEKGSLLATSITVSGQHKQPIPLTSNAQSTRPPLALKTYVRAAVKKKGEAGKRGTLLKPPLNRPRRAAAVERVAYFG